jgi:hypothetical protein
MPQLLRRVGDAKMGSEESNGRAVEEVEWRRKDEEVARKAGPVRRRMRDGRSTTQRAQHSTE